MPNRTVRTVGNWTVGVRGDIGPTLAREGLGVTIVRAQAINASTASPQYEHLTIALGKSNVHFCFRFRAPFRPNVTPRPVPTGPAWKMVQNATKISIGAQLQSSFVEIVWSMPETYM